MELEEIKIDKTEQVLGLKVYLPNGKFIDYIDTSTQLYRLRKDIALSKVLKKTEFLKVVHADITFHIDFMGNLVTIDDDKNVSEIGQIMDHNRDNFVINLY